MNTSSSSGTTLFENGAVARVRRCWKVFLLIFVASFTGIAALVMILPVKYESRMEVLVGSDRQSLVISPNEGKESTAFQDLAENRVNSEIALMTSRDVLQDVVIKSDLAHDPGAVSAAGPPSEWSINKAVNSLGKHLTIEPIKKSDVISVTYKAPSPELATAVMKNLADTYLSLHLKAHAKPGSFKFFDEQTDTFANKLAESENQLKAFRQQHAFGDPEEKTPLTMKALEAQAALDETSAQAADYVGRISTSVKKLAELEPRVVSQVHTIPQTNVASQLNASIAELQNKRTEALTKFLPNDRMVLQIDKEIADTKATLQSLKSSPDVETTTDLNQLHEDAEKDLISSEVILNGLEARKARLKANLQSYKDRLSDVASTSTQNDQLTLAVRENEDKYLLYSKEREESRIADSLDKQRITDVSLVESPTFEVQPVSPLIPVDLIIGFMLSLMVAYIGITIFEMFGSRGRAESSPLAIGATAS
jgi:uncharacterized protein involved in exopolysaccharide biosynthesis